jgi:hypothetical protein
MSTKSSFPLTASQAAIAAAGRTSIGEKLILAAVLVVLALLYAKGVTLMIDTADKPSPYTTFLNRAD